MTDREVLNILNDKRTRIRNPYYSNSELEEIQKIVVYALIHKVAFDESIKEAHDDRTSI